MIDARGLRCPWPVVRLARALREGATSVTIVADDPIAATEITAFAQGKGLCVEEIVTDLGRGWRIEMVT